MSTATFPALDTVYPESDGKPMADNTVQWEWMVLIVEELREQFAGQEVFVAGDLLWYPVEGQPRISAAPDAMVVFGRPAGDRRSYLQWMEGGLAPQVVFEVLSLSNTDQELEAKLQFYELHGVEEYYVIDPYDQLVYGYTRRALRLSAIRKVLDFTSPRLGIRFEKSDGELRIVSRSGRPFQTRSEQVGDLKSELVEKREELQAERKQKEQFAAKLRELGIDPDQL